MIKYQIILNFCAFVIKAQHNVAFDTASCKRWQAQGIQFRPNNPTVFGFTEAVSDTACEIKPQLFKSQKSRISLVTRA